MLSKEKKYLYHLKRLQVLKFGAISQRQNEKCAKKLMIRQ
jgi:hypothetical protein